MKPRVKQLVLCSAVTGTHDVLSGPDLLGQLAALHCTQVQVLVEELSIQDVSHSVLQTAPVTVQHSGRETVTVIKLTAHFSVNILHRQLQT